MSKGRIKTMKDRLSERDNLPPDKLENNCQLKIIDIVCKDCGKVFEWYAGTLRCASCYKIKRNSYYKIKIGGIYKRKRK